MINRINKNINNLSKIKYSPKTFFKKGNLVTKPFLKKERFKIKQRKLIGTYDNTTNHLKKEKAGVVQIKMYYSGIHLSSCSGTILKQNLTSLILTAAHCANPSDPFTNKARCDPRFLSVSAIGLSHFLSKTPINCFFTFAGFDNGPRILKIVLTPSFCLTGPTYFIAG